MLHYNRNVGVLWYAHNNKNILPAIIAGASLLGAAALSHKSAKTAAASQADANATNLQIARETNQANADLWREQSAYNTPTNQMQRYRDAGINPYMAMSNITSGNAESAPQMQGTQVSAEYNSVAQAADNQALSYLTSAANQTYDILSKENELKAQRAQNRILNAEAKYREDIVFQQLLGMQQDVLNKRKYGSKLNLENFYLPTMNDKSLQKIEQDIKESNQRVSVMSIQKGLLMSQVRLNGVMIRYNTKLTEYQQKQLDSFATRFRMEINEAKSRIRANNASASASNELVNVYKAQGKLLQNQAEKVFKETQGLNPDAAYKAAYWFKEKAMFEAMGAENNLVYNNLNHFEQMFGGSDNGSSFLDNLGSSVAPAAGAAIGSYFGSPVAGAAAGSAIGGSFNMTSDDVLNSYYK